MSFEQNSFQLHDIPLNNSSDDIENNIIDNNSDIFIDDLVLQTPIKSFICNIIKYLVVISFPIVQISYGIYYLNNTNCNSYITVSEWLIISGITSLLTIISSSNLIINETKNTCAIIFYTIYTLILINIIWIIFGIIMFIRNYIYCKPSDIIVLMEISLFFKCIVMYWIITCLYE